MESYLSRGISDMLNANSLTQDLNLCHRVHYDDNHHNMNASNYTIKLFKATNYNPEKQL